jgi:hypothetical protein
LFSVKKVFVATLALFVLLLVASSAAATTKEEIGPRINVLLGTPTTFPANTPFHIEHGWGVPPEGRYDAIGEWSFVLDVDGMRRAADFVIRETFPPFDTGLSVPFLGRTWVFNFADGMIGTHTFTGHWLAPCQAAVDSGLFAGPCPADPAQVVDTLTRSLTVTFTP